MGRAIKTLLFSTLYPSAVRPQHGVFVETRLRELLKSGQVEVRVVAPVPWFPSIHPRWGPYAVMARTPAWERRNDIEVLHPRYPSIPKLGMNLAPLLLAMASLAPLRRLVDGGFDFDVIDAHYYYPDGVAAALLAQHFRKPLVITARGSDVNLIARYRLPRRMMRWAAQQARASVGVSQALVDAMRAMGMPSERLHMFRNGVDLERFMPLEQTAAREQIGHDGSPLLLCVGNLLELKGQHVCIDALAELLPRHPQARLLVVGEGPDRNKLLAHAQARGVGDRVHLIGGIPNTALAPWYSAADFLLLASSREGWPNVLLEAMACGTPAIGCAVGGIPEVIASDQCGRVVRRRDGKAFADAVNQCLREGLDRRSVRQYAESFGWAVTTQQQLELFDRLAAEHMEAAS